MKVNKELIAKARFEKKTISELTVKEFRDLMQECFDADRSVLIIRKVQHEEAIRKAYEL